MSEEKLHCMVPASHFKQDLVNYICAKKGLKEDILKANKFVSCDHDICDRRSPKCV